MSWAEELKKKNMLFFDFPHKVFSVEGAETMG
jgi:hypothetical protein